MYTNHGICNYMVAEKKSFKTQLFRESIARPRALGIVIITKQLINIIIAAYNYIGREGRGTANREKILN